MYGHKNCLSIAIKYSSAVRDTDKQEIDEAIEKIWAGNLEPDAEQYDTFRKFVSKNGKRFTRRQKEKANLTEVMLLHQLFRHTEAEELIAKHKTSFNAIEDACMHTGGSECNW